MRDKIHYNIMRAAAFGAARMVELSAKTVGWQPVSLEPEALEADARRAARLEDFGDPYYREGLGRLVHSLEHDADLHLFGRAFMRGLIHIALVNRLLLQQHRRTHPEIHQAPLRSPIIITGLPRTGSTFLHRLMSRIPGFFAPPYWMLVRPLPGREGEPEELRQSLARRDVGRWKAITPSLRNKHHLNTDAPEECIFALALTFQTQLFMGPAESYLAWYANCDRRGKYADYRSILLALQAARPGQTLLLKAPDHLGGLDALCAAVPEARIVQLHRDPVKVMNSFASLAYSSQFALTNREDPARLAASLGDYLETTLRRNLAQRPRLNVPVLDFHYDQLSADPLGTAARILKGFDEPFPERGRAAMAKYVARKAKSERPQHHYSGAEFGLDDGRTAERFGFYSASFPNPDRRFAVDLTLPYRRRTEIPS